jgi:hypothetical protein
MIKDLINTSFGFKDYSSASNPFPTYLKNAMGTLAANATVSDCMHQRLSMPRKLWSTACANPNLDAKSNPDVSFQLNAASGSPYTIYSKIVDTMDRSFLVIDTSTMVQSTITIAGNSDASTIVLEGGSTSEGGGVTVPHYPYVYRVEVKGERQQSIEKAALSIMYAF